MVSLKSRFSEPKLNLQSINITDYYALKCLLKDELIVPVISWDDVTAGVGGISPSYV